MSSLYEIRNAIANIQNSLSSNPSLIGTEVDEVLAHLENLELRKKAQESRANELADSIRKRLMMIYKKRSEELHAKK